MSYEEDYDYEPKKPNVFKRFGQWLRNLLQGPIGPVGMPGPQGMMGETRMPDDIPCKHCGTHKTDAIRFYWSRRPENILPPVDRLSPARLAPGPICFNVNPHRNGDVIYTCPRCDEQTEFYTFNGILFLKDETVVAGVETL